MKECIQLFAICLSFLAAFSVSKGMAQSITNGTIGSAGSTSSVGVNKVSYTVGQPAVTTLKTSKTMLTQGLHQPNYEVVTGIFTQKAGNRVTVKAWPNPFVKELNVRLEGLINDRPDTYELLDISGHIVQVGSISEDSFQLQVEELSSGTYLLRIIGAQQTLQTLQLQKTSN